LGPPPAEALRDEGRVEEELFRVRVEEEDEDFEGINFS